MCFIQDYRNVYQIGRAFGTLTRENGDESLHMLFGAFGKVLDPDTTADHIKKLLTDPNPYLV
jgi:hypothetical protein